MISKEMLNEVDVDDILEALGLERRGFGAFGSIVPGIGMFVFGAAVGAAIGLAFAPKAGTEMRDDLGRRVDEIKNKINAGMHKANGGRRSGRGSATGSQVS